MNRKWYPTIVASVALVAVTTASSSGIEPIALSTSVVMVYDENGGLLESVTSVVQIQSILDVYGASTAPDDPILPSFLETAIDLTNVDFRNGDEVVVWETSIQATFNANGNLLEETLEVTGMLGSDSVLIHVTSRSGGVLSLALTLFDHEGSPEEYDFPLQVF